MSGKGSKEDARRVLAADTSFLISLFGTDANTAEAIALVNGLTSPLTLCSFNDLELLNACFMAEFQAFTEPGSSVRIESILRSERDEGRLLYPPFEPGRAISRAISLSRRHTLGKGHRTFDVLLVAAALELGAAEFLTFDERQARLAIAEGLSVCGVPRLRTTRDAE